MDADSISDFEDLAASPRSPGWNLVEATGELRREVSNTPEPSPAAAKPAPTPVMVAAAPVEAAAPVQEAPAETKATVADTRAPVVVGAAKHPAASSWSTLASQKRVFVPLADPPVRLYTAPVVKPAKPTSDDDEDAADIVLRKCSSDENAPATHAPVCTVAVVTPGGAVSGLENAKTGVPYSIHKQKRWARVPQKAVDGSELKRLSRTGSVFMVLDSNDPSDAESNDDDNESMDYALTVPTTQPRPGGKTMSRRHKRRDAQQAKSKRATEAGLAAAKRGPALVVSARPPFPSQDSVSFEARRPARAAAARAAIQE